MKLWIEEEDGNRRRMSDSEFAELFYMGGDNSAQEVVTLRRKIQRIIRDLGSQVPCRRCNGQVWLLKSQEHGVLVFDDDGDRHFKHCEMRASQAPPQQAGSDMLGGFEFQ